MVQLRAISKSFPGVLACQHIDLDIEAGEVHALLGENGAGKSTLMNMLTGIYRPDAGEILMDGHVVSFSSPGDAMAAGIGMVHQHFKLVRSFTVAENVHLGWERTPGLIRARDLEARTQKLAAELGLSVRPEARIDDLSTGEQQRVEILRVLSRAARVLILDEPTAVLTPAEAQELFKTLKSFVARGHAAILISHKLDEVLAIADRITVLRGGRKVTTERARDCTASRLAELMVGRDLERHAPRAAATPLTPPMAAPPPTAVPPREPILRLTNVSLTEPSGRTRLDRISLDLYPGEIIGIAGVAGNGQRELSEVLTGMRPPSRGEILLGGADFSRRSAREFAAFGVGHIPEDRLHSGLAPAASITDNAVMREYARAPIATGPLYRPGRAFKLAASIAAAAAVSVANFSMPIGNLSGGNQQRLVARREMRIATRVLVAAYPSRGLDVGAIDTMQRYFRQLRDGGVAVLVISEELDELLHLADRIAVMSRGGIMGLLNPATASLEHIGLLMAGRQS